VKIKQGPARSSAVFCLEQLVLAGLVTIDQEDLEQYNCRHQHHLRKVRGCEGGVGGGVGAQRAVGVWLGVSACDSAGCHPQS
jgi:hypothetical protein